jgi:hypothetical protein
MSDDTIDVTTVTCPHCGDVTTQYMLLAEFTCGACDRPFSPTPPVTPKRLGTGKYWTSGDYARDSKPE